MGRLSNTTADHGNIRSEARAGETITIRIKDLDGKDTGQTMVFTRTDRAYVYDLCDAYNDHRTRRDTEWYVTEAGELKLGVPAGETARNTRDMERRRESERQQWLRNHRALTVKRQDEAA